MIRKFRENDNENGRHFAKINYFRMSFENFAKKILRKFGNPNYNAGRLHLQPKHGIYPQNSPTRGQIIRKAEIAVKKTGSGNFEHLL